MSFEDSRHAGDGIDLPPIPAGVLRDGWNLSRVTERDEPNESVLMRQTLSEMGPALSAFDTSLRTISRDVSYSRTNHEAWSDSVPVLLRGEAIGMSSSIASLATDEELMAQEMESVFDMDTPTRSKFIDSSPLGRPTISETRLASFNCDTSGSPVPSFKSAASVLLPEQDKSPTDILTDHEVNASTPNFRYSTYALPLTSHPYPPPLHPSDSIVIPDLIAIPAAHPPLHNLVNKGSTETMRTETSTTTGSTASPTPIPEFRPSRQELILVKQLKLRRSQSAMGFYEDTKADEGEGVGIGSRRGLRPLRLMADRDANRMSAPLPVVGAKGKEKEAMVSRGSKSSVEARAKMSAASGKISRSSKASNGSGATGLRV